MSETISSKKLLREYGIFLAFAIFSLSFVFVSSLVLKKYGEAKLKNELQFFLDENVSDKFLLEKKITLDAFADFNAHIFEAGSSYILLLRIQTLYGPSLGVFSYKQNQSAEFLGLLSSSLSDEKISVQKKNISYWLSRIPLLMQEKFGA